MDVRIEKLVYGGEGLGHQDGYTIFVPFVLPEEVVSIHESIRKKKFIRGRVQQIVTASPMRAEPLCLHFTQCGGCHYQHIPYESQVLYKAEILRETLWRIGRIRWDADIAIHRSPPFGYRNRAQWKIRRLGGRDCIGYFEAGTSALCPVEQCPILSPCLAAVLQSLQEILDGNALPGSITEVEAFADSSDSRILMNVDCSTLTAAPEEMASRIRASLPNAESILIHEARGDRFSLSGAGFLTTSVAGYDFRVGHLSFFQSNRFLLEELCAAVTIGASGELALDLFAGIGLFTLPLAQRFSKVVAVEANEAAARDLEANIDRGGISAEHRFMDAAPFLRDWRICPDLVVLDPPRSGIAAAAIERLVELAPKRVHYVSCDPATLARDLAKLTAGGYVIEEVHFFDLFPQSFHIESLVLLAR